MRCDSLPVRLPATRGTVPYGFPPPARPAQWPQNWTPGTNGCHCRSAYRALGFATLHPCRLCLRHIKQRRGPPQYQGKRDHEQMFHKTFHAANIHKKTGVSTPFSTLFRCILLIFTFLPATTPGHKIRCRQPRIGSSYPHNTYKMRLYTFRGRNNFAANY